MLFTSYDFQSSHPGYIDMEFKEIHSRDPIDGKGWPICSLEEFMSLIEEEFCPDFIRDSEAPDWVWCWNETHPMNKKKSNKKRHLKKFWKKIWDKYGEESKANAYVDEQERVFESECEELLSADKQAEEKIDYDVWHNCPF